MNRLLELAKQDLANARDNLYRAKSAARHCDPSNQWGQSGQTLNDIIAGYKKMGTGSFGFRKTSRSPLHGENR